MVFIFSFFCLLTYLTLWCVSCTSLYLNPYSSDLIISAFLFGWLDHLYLMKLLIWLDLPVRFCYFPFVSCLLLLLFLRSLSLNDWKCYFNSFADCFTSSIVPKQMNHWVEPRGSRSSQLVLAWKNLHQHRGMGGRQFYSCFLRRGFDYPLSRPLPEVLPAIHF